MTVVPLFRCGRPNKLASAANQADAPWFIANPGRDHRVRRATSIERQQARCLHGGLDVGQEWFVAARRGSGLIERRFLPMSEGRDGNIDERTAQWLFDGALIAGAPPEDDPQTEPPEAA